MRKLLSVLVFGFIVPTGASAQQVEIVPFYGFQGGGGLEIEDGSLGFSSGDVVGLMVDVRVQQQGTIEFLYSRQGSQLKTKGPIFEPGEFLFDLDIDYIQFGGVYEFFPGDFRPIVALSLGATRFAPRQAGLDDEWRFSGTIGGGVKYFLNDRFGVRAQANALITLLDNGSTFFCTLPGGCLVIVAGDTSTQGNVLGALIIAF